MADKLKVLLQRWALLFLSLRLVLSFRGLFAGEDLQWNEWYQFGATLIVAILLTLLRTKNEQE